MDKAARRRGIVLAMALVATVAAIFVDPPEGAGQGVSAVPRVRAAAKPDSGVSSVATVFVEDADADPFAARGWEEPPPPPPPPPAVVAPVVSAAPAVPPPPPGPPPLPFRYVGRFSDDSGSVVYLARGDAALLAHLGDVLDNAYKVTAIEAKRVEFEHLETGSKQTLAIPERE